MGTEVLLLHDYYHIDCPHHQRSLPGSDCRCHGVPNPVPRPTTCHVRRSRREREVPPGRFVRARSEPAIPTQEASHEDAVATGRSGGGNLVVERVTILRRGESLDSATMMGGGGGSPFGVFDGDVYAGMAFVASPEPSSLPVPSFGTMTKGGGRSVDDSATRDLRRLLRLD